MICILPVDVKSFFGVDVASGVGRSKERAAEGEDGVEFVVGRRGRFGGVAGRMSSGAVEAVAGRRWTKRYC